MESKQYLEDQVAALQKQVSSIESRLARLAEFLDDGLKANTQAGCRKELPDVLRELSDFRETLG